ncbi:hypothetical protein DPMN_053761 [Dreissena polymorpha]|uniref:Uncharacterized protein n=1 Tax=Dreissena polymorpha TaxID=45954 RepID=A0A9D4CN94_DREPO|nr:hypothetical protein DPMN_053761 [Dreissena polymorpha]
MEWKTYITNITKRANFILGFIRSNLKHCPSNCRKNAYLELVWSKLEYLASYGIHSTKQTLTTYSVSSVKPKGSSTRTTTPDSRAVSQTYFKSWTYHYSKTDDEPTG